YPCVSTPQLARPAILSERAPRRPPIPASSARRSECGGATDSPPCTIPSPCRHRFLGSETRNLELRTWKAAPPRHHSPKIVRSEGAFYSDPATHWQRQIMKMSVSVPQGAP